MADDVKKNGVNQEESETPNTKGNLEGVIVDNSPMRASREEEEFEIFALLMKHGEEEDDAKKVAKEAADAIWGKVTYH